MQDLLYKVSTVLSAVRCETLLPIVYLANILACKVTTLCNYVNQFSLSSFSWFFPVLLVCTWRHGGHIGDQEQKHFYPLGTKLHFHVNSSRTNSMGHFRVPKLSLSKWGQAHNLSCENDWFAWEYTECKYGGPLGRPGSSCAKARLVRPR